MLVHSLTALALAASTAPASTPDTPISGPRSYTCEQSCFVDMNCWAWKIWHCWAGVPE